MAQAPAPPESGSDPSMDDILASIRRILSDEEKTAKPAAPPDDVFMLDPSMMVEDPSAPAPAPVAPPAPMPAPDAHALPVQEPAVHEVTHVQRMDEEQAAPSRAPEPAGEPTITSEPVREAAPPGPAPHAADLVAPEAAAAAASAVSALMRTLVAERSASVQRGGPTIEDVVREVIRPLLKDWLDAHLPALVERLVRAEIERVVGRSGG